MQFDNNDPELGLQLVKLEKPEKSRLERLKELSAMLDGVLEKIKTRHIKRKAV